MVKRKGNLDDEEETLPHVSADFTMTFGSFIAYVKLCW
jgi:hypothetical protein